MLRIAVLCNDRLAIPALSQLLANKALVSVGITENINESHSIVQALCKKYQVPLKLFKKQTFSEDHIQWLDTYEPDVVMVKTFPWKIPEQSLSKPKHGFLNFHYAPLPQWRGSNPLFWMVKNQVNEVGVTVHQMDANFDTGPIVFQKNFSLAPRSTFGMLYTQLAYAGMELTHKIIEALLTGKLEKKEQDPMSAKWYGRPQPADLCIRWMDMTAHEIVALANACNPWNKGAATRLENWTMGITFATVMSPINIDLPPGTIVEIDAEKGLLIACKNGELIKADIIYTEEGFIPGHALGNFGIKKGLRFNTI